MVTDDNGLYYMRARYYNPEIKRFINQDILTGNIGNHKSLNRYSYVQGNPVSYTDPFGLSPFSYISEPIHSVLSMAGCIPVIGNFFDGLNSVVYLMEGDTAKAVLNLTSLIPGDKLGKYVVKNGRKIATVTAITAVICQTDAGAGLKQGLTDAGNEIAEFYGLDDMSAMDYLFMGIYGFRFAKGAKGGLLDIDLPSSNKAPEVEIAGTGVTVKADSFDDVLYRADDAAPANVNKGGVGFESGNNIKYSGADDVIQYEKLKAQYAANEIFNAERIGSGLKSDPYHRAASFVSEEQLSQGRVFGFTNGDGREMILLQTEGNLNGILGIYEYILNPQGQVEHQFFKQGCGMIGY